jgi:hypothetical protein
MTEYLMDLAIKLGFVSINELLFLLPAGMFIVFRIYMGKNFTSGWILPLLYSFFVTEKFWA